MNIEFSEQRLDRLFTEVKTKIPLGGTELLTPSTVYGVVPQSSLPSRPHQVSRDDFEVHPAAPGDFVISMSSFLHGFEYCEISGGISPDYTLLRPNFHPDIGRFLKHSLKSNLLIQKLTVFRNGIRQGQRLQWNRIRYVKIPVPDVEGAKRVADFLDCETARIDLLIEKKQRLVKLLAERLEELIEERLASVSPSKMHRLKFAIRKIEQGWSPQCEDIRVEGHRWGVLKLGAITTGVYLEEHHKALPIGVDPIASLKVKSGDVLVARASGSPKLVGKAAYVENSNLNLMLSDKHFRLVPNPKKARSEYLATVVNSRASRRQIEDRLSSAEGMARNVGQNVIYGLKCPFPSLDEQDAILATIRSWQGTTAQLSNKTNASIVRLKEYRSALITAAVTGQIDVASHSRSDASESSLNAPREEMDA